MGRDFDAWEERGRLMVQMPDRLLDLPPPSLFGAHQFDNAGLAVAAALTFDRSAHRRGGHRPRASPRPSGRRGSSG